MKKLLVALFALLFVTYASAACTQDYSGSKTFSAAIFKLSWFLNCSTETITFTMIANTQAGSGYLAMGFGTDMGEDNSPVDMYVGVYNYNGVPLTVTDRTSYGEHTPTIDDTQNIVGTSTFLFSNYPTITFSRKLSTGDDLDFNITSGDIKVIYAIGPLESEKGETGKLGKHYYQGKSLVNFFSNGATSETDFKAAHGILMMMAWTTLVPISVFLARFLKAAGKIWFIAHQVSNWIVVFISVVAWIEVWAMMGMYGERIHHIIGTGIVLVSVAQSILGVIADKMWNPARKSPPILPDRLHHWLGRLLFVVSVFQMYVGYVEYAGGSVSYVPGGVWATYSIWIAAQVLIFGVGEWKIQVKSHGEEGEEGHEKVDKKAVYLFVALVVVNILGVVIVSSVMASLRAQL